MGRWYVTGYCRLVNEERTFRVDRIRSIETLDEAFERPDTVPEPGVGYTASDTDIVCTIDLDRRALWVLEYYPVEILEKSADTARIRFSAPDPEVPARLLLRLGADARLVEGSEVADRVRQMGTRLRERYQ
jgi:proteasome accessory factor C